MPRTSTLAAVEIGLQTEPQGLRIEPDPERFRILVAGDFSGGAGRNRRPVKIDRDNFDRVLALLAPQLRVQGDLLLFRELDDFDPDRLLEQPGPLKRLRDLRSQIAGMAPRVQAAPKPPAELANVSGAELLRRMMGEAPAQESGATDAWQRLLREMVGKYAAPGPDPQQTDMIARTDAVTAEELRALLHHPAFQDLESAWRGIRFLVGRVRTGETLEIHVLDLPHAELAAGGLGDLARALEQESWGAIAGLYYFAANEEETLARIAGMAQQAGAPFLAGLAPEIAGMTPVFEGLRETLKARWLGLAMPRFLLRLPYGPETVPIDSFAFDEMPQPPEHQHYLWGHPALACACLLAQAFERDGWRMRPGTVAEIDGLPAHSYRRDGEAQLLPCAEILMTEQAAAILLERGFMPLASIKGTDRVRLVRFQSMARPPAPIAGKWQ